MSTDTANAAIHISLMVFRRIISILLASVDQFENNIHYDGKFPFSERDVTNRMPDRRFSKIVK